MRTPSTRMSSVVTSALVPISRTVSPLTVTRPSAITCSAARRDAMPARDRIFWRRSCMSGLRLLARHVERQQRLRVVLVENGDVRRRGRLDGALQAFDVHLLAEDLRELLDARELGQVL